MYRTNVSYFKKSEFAVNRRFSDFLGLHQKLSEKYLQNGRIIPPAPDKSVVGTTKIKMAKEAENQVQDEVANFHAHKFYFSYSTSGVIWIFENILFHPQRNVSSHLLRFIPELYPAIYFFNVTKLTSFIVCGTPPRSSWAIYKSYSPTSIFQGWSRFQRVLGAWHRPPKVQSGDQKKIFLIKAFVLKYEYSFADFKTCLLRLLIQI